MWRRQKKYSEKQWLKFSKFNENYKPIYSKIITNSKQKKHEETYTNLSHNQIAESY
jgi:hypothetical protein